MATFIPFITGDTSFQLANKHYSAADYFRVPLDKIEKCAAGMKVGQLWIDAGIDGMDDIEVRIKPDTKNAWFDCLDEFPHFRKIADKSYAAKPNKSEVAAFVDNVLDKCLTFQPSCITVPQLPMTDGSARNKLNRMLAEATGNWKSKVSYSGTLILPIVFTHQSQLRGKTIRNSKVSTAEKCFLDANAAGYWAVDADLKDESGSKTLTSRRFPDVIGLHEELNAKLGARMRVGGPYWGLNLILWSKGLTDYPAVGVGGGFQYFLSGTLHGSTPSPRLALPPLRRRAVANPELEKWLLSVSKSLATSHPAHAAFSGLHAKYGLFVANYKDQVAGFYRSWIEAIAALPASGRSLGVFQDLSTAYALGRALPDLKDTPKRPESVAEPLMLSCL